MTSQPTLSLPPVEFPAVLLNTSTGEVESEFHSYVQPQERPTLSEFCTQLTGITQVEMPISENVLLIFESEYSPLSHLVPRRRRWRQRFPFTSVCLASAAGFKACK